MSDQTSEFRPILVMYQDTDETQLEDGSKGLFSRVGEKATRVGALNLAEFASNLDALCSQLGSIFNTVSPQRATAWTPLK